MDPSNEVRKILDKHPEMKPKLFRRGYLITDAQDLDLNTYPFFEQWERHSLGHLSGRNLQLILHRDQSATVFSSGENTMVLIGHAYNPFTMEVNEPKILESLMAAWKRSQAAFLDEINDLTGIFLIVVRAADSLFAVQDACGLKACFFGTVSQRIYISSHPQLVADLKGLSMDPFVAKLVKSKMYNVGNRHLPGNMSPFSALRRLGGNTHLSFDSTGFKIKRFFPFEPPAPFGAKVMVEAAVEELSGLLSQSLKAVSMKWQQPAISLTGGTDSKTTLACAAELYDKFSYFSYASKPTEKLDAGTAKAICRSLGLPHTYYPIPSSNDEISDFKLHKKIIDHNTNYSKNMADSEIRKMIFLEQHNDFDVEVKSWVSEIVRVFLERTYDLNFPKQLTPRHFSILQTRYFGTPNLLKRSDEINKEFISETTFDQASELYEATDLYYWEVSLGAWGSSVVSAFDYCHEVTVPFNNRRLLELFLSIPRELRKNDWTHSAIRQIKEPKIAATDVDVRNKYFHRRRIMLEKIYYFYRIGPHSLKRAMRRNSSE